MDHMKEIAKLLESLGAFMVGLSALITAVKPTKKEISKNKRLPRRLKK